MGIQKIIDWSSVMNHDVKTSIYRYRSSKKVTSAPRWYLKRGDASPEPTMRPMKKGLVTVRPERLSCRSTCRVSVLKGLVHEIFLYCTNRQAVLVSQYQDLSSLKLCTKTLNWEKNLDQGFQTTKMCDKLRTTQSNYKKTLRFYIWPLFISLVRPNGTNVFVSRRLYPFSPPATTAEFGSYLSSLYS